MPHKYGAKRTECRRGHSHPSNKEALRCDDLNLMARGGEIDQLEFFPQFPLVVNGIKIGKFTADFRYRDARTNVIVIEDVKGYSKGEAYRLRKKLVEAVHRITITET